MRQRIDDRADIGGEQDIVDPDGARLAIHLCFDDVAGEFEVARLTRFVGSVVLAEDFDRRTPRDPLGHFVKGCLSIGADEAVVFQADAAGGPAHRFGSQFLQPRLELHRARLGGSTQDMRDALSANPRIGRRSRRVTVADHDAPRIDRHHRRRHPPQHGIRSTALVGDAGQHLDLASGGQSHDHRCLAGADVAHAERHPPTTTGCTGVSQLDSRSSASSTSTARAR